MILDDVYKQNPGGVVDLFVLDATSLGGSTNRFHSGLNELKNNIVWQGNNYFPFPIEFKGLSKSSQGKQSRPTVTVANVSSLFGTLIANYNDLVGASFTRKRTLIKYLDAVNFAAGNPNADSQAHFPDETFVINRKVSENKVFVQFELATWWEVYQAILPARRIIANQCVWQYRKWNGSSWDEASPNSCGYAGSSYFKEDDTTTADPYEDVCGKRLSSCKKRFGDYGPLPFSSFPK